MRALEYSLRQGVTSLWRHRGSSLLAVVAIGLALVVLGAVLLVTWNAERWLASRAASAELSVYLDDGISAEARAAIERELDASDAIVGHGFVSKAEARAAFRSAFADLAVVADELDNPFPASIDARVRPGKASELSSGGLLARLATLSGVVDVRYDREWLARVEEGTARVRAAGGVMGLILAIAAAVTVATVVRLGLYARREELEIMTLVGSPLAFIRGPCIAEGVMQGGLGALLSLAVLGVLFLTVVRGGGAGPGGLLEVATLEFLPVLTSAGLVLGGMVVGAVGGFAASRHAA